MSHDPFTLFKILIVVLVVVYQGVQALRKKSKASAPPPVPPIPSFEPEPIPQTETKRGETMERIRTLVLGRAQVDPPAVAPPPPASSIPAAVVSMTTSEPIRSLEAPASQGIPSLRDLVLAQVILSPPPGSNGGRRTGRSPLELRR